MIDFLRRILRGNRGLAYPTLSLVNDLNKLRELLGIPVYDIEGEMLGKINRIVVSRKEKRAKQVFIRLKHGVAKVRPEDLLMVRERIVYIGREKLDVENDEVIIEGNEGVERGLGQINVDDFIKFLKG